MRTIREDGKARTLRAAGDHAVSGCLIAALLVLICGMSVVVMWATPGLWLALLVGGPAVAFRHQIGRNVAGVILLVLGIVQLTVLAATYEQYESTDDQEWFSDGRRNPCGAREALMLVSLGFVAGGVGLFARQAWCVRHNKRITFEGGKAERADVSCVGQPSGKDWRHE
ncbi:MAG: hypothetical protein IJ658_13915 [Kiritimatiellae bacterium]|nr:hypothetical protein [Kiritimatiellia bacterium]